MLKFCPSCGSKILQAGKFCHECGCSLQSAFENKDSTQPGELVAIQPALDTCEEPNDFFKQFAEVERKEREQNEKVLKKAKTFFLNYKLDAAEPLLLELSDKGNLRAQYMLGVLYENGYGGLEHDVSKAINLFANTCDAGEILGGIHLLSFHINDETKDMVPTLNQLILEELAELEASDDPLVQYEVANYYACEHADQIDYKKAMHFYQKAARQGYWKALTALGNIYLSGSNCVPDVKKAIQCYEQAGLKGDKDAAYLLGCLYQSGTLLEKDQQKSIQWHSIAAEQNDTNSLRALKALFLEEKKYSPALKAYEKELQLNPASDSSIELAILYLGLNDAHPDFPQDDDKSVVYLKKALEFDETAPAAMFLLGLCHYAGKGVEQDLSIAEKYLKKAYETGADEVKEVAKDLLDKIHNEKQASESSGCFITTAVCNSLCKADDCYELQMFRAFRDHWLKQQADGAALISEYYYIAPKIVKRIDVLANSQELYKSIWERYLKACLHALEQNEPQKCKNIYTKMVNDLRKMFL